MSKHWKEQYNPLLHNNKMWGERCEVHETKDFKLDPAWVYFVKTGSFTFEFHSIQQIKTCLEFYQQKTHASSIISQKDLPDCGGDHGETQRWYERLPQWLLEESKRKKVIKALEKAILEFSE